MYTMKSGYIELMRAAGQGQDGVEDGFDRRWRWIWRLGVNPKVQLFDDFFEE